MRTLAARLSLLTLVTACSTVESSAYVARPLPASTGPVAIGALRDPPGAEELGAVEAHGRLPTATLEAVVTEFRKRVAGMGGDYGRIDTMATTHEMVNESREYECGTTETEFQTRVATGVGTDGSPTFSADTVPVTRYVPKTCSEQRTVEAATFTVTGRAFRTSRGNP